MNRAGALLGLGMGWLCLGLAPAFAGEAPLQPDDYFSMSLEELMQLHVATGTPRTLRDAPAVATVITAQDIAAMGARTLEEALAMVPGLHVSVRTHTGAPKYLFRGIGTDSYNPQTLLLVNGLPMTSLVRGDRSAVWRWNPIGQIARIEIIRGPGSALYGAEAFGGVINLITHDADSLPAGEVGLAAGSYDSREAWARQPFELGGWRGLVGAQWRDSDGPREIIEADFQTRLDSIAASIPGVDPTPRSRAPGPGEFSVRGWNFDLDLARGPWQLRLSEAHRHDMGTGVGVAEALDPDGRFGPVIGRYELAYVAPEWREHWGLEARLSRLRIGQEVESPLSLFPPGAFAFALPFPDGITGNPEFDERNDRVDLALVYDGWQGHRLRFGAGFSDAEVYSVRETKNFRLVLVNTPTGRATVFVPLGSVVDVTDTADIYMPEGGRRSWSAFVQDEWELGERWQLVYGLRHDHYSDFGASNNPRAALVWQANERFTSKLLYGSAFRAPSWAELYSINNPIALGNPDLKPERLRNLELAFAWTPSEALSVGLNLFAYRSRDGIQFRINPNGQQAQNVIAQRGRGAEFEFRYRPEGGRWSLLGNASHARATDETLDVPVGLAPEKRAYLRLDWKFGPRWSADAQLTAVGERQRAPGDSRPPLGGFVKLDVALHGHDLFGGVAVDLALRNALDADIREPGSTSIPFDLPQPGRNLMLSLSWPL